MFINYNFMIDCSQRNQREASKVDINFNSITYMLSCLCKGQIEQKAEEKLQRMWTALKITIGNLIVKGYRTFKYYLEQEVIIFWRRDIYQTNYLFLKLVQKKDQPFSGQFFKQISYCVQEIEKFKKKKLNTFSVVLLFTLNYSLIEVVSNQEIRPKLFSAKIETLQKLLQIIPKQGIKEENFIPEGVTKEDVFIGEDPQQHRKLKQILHSYIDTFGLKYKANYYKQVSKKVDYLINTLNLIIFEETKPLGKPGTVTPMYNQIESANWSQFKRGRLECDRKDIVLSGQGKVLFIDLTFSYKLQQYIDIAYEDQAKQLLFQCQKSYSESKIKVIKIENSLTPRHVYSYFTKTIH